MVTPTQRETGKAGGFALMEMAEAKDEDSAISALEGAKWLGCQSRVKKSQPKTNDSSSRPLGRSRGGHNSRFTAG